MQPAQAGSQPHCSPICRFCPEKPRAGKCYLAGTARTPGSVLFLQRRAGGNQAAAAAAGPAPSQLWDLGHHLALSELQGPCGGMLTPPRVHDGRPERSVELCPLLPQACPQKLLGQGRLKSAFCSLERGCSESRCGARQPSPPSLCPLSGRQVLRESPLLRPAALSQHMAASSRLIPFQSQFFPTLLSSQDHP